MFALGSNLLTKRSRFALLALTAVFYLLSSSFAGAQATVSPASVNFGNVVVNQTSMVKAVTLKNTQTASVSIRAITVPAGGYALDPSTTCPNPGSLAAGASCTIGITLTPTALGAVPAGNLTIDTNASNSPSLVPLKATGSEPTALSPSSVGFGDVPVSTTSAVKTVSLYNYQLTPITISPLSVAAPYAISGGTCGATLNAKSSCTILLTVTPSALGAVPATSLTVTTSAPNSPLTVALSATGSAPTALSATALSFGDVPVSTTSAFKTVTLYNYQLTPITISPLSVAAPYAISGGTCGATLNAKSSCTILLTVTPSALGAVPATSLTVTTSAANSPLTVALSATGSAPTALSATAVSFGNVPVSTTSAVKTVSLYNYQLTPISISSITVPAGGYALAPSTTCPNQGSLGGRTSCTIGITLTPTALGAIAAGSLTVTTSAPNSPLTGSLTGTGIGLLKSLSCSSASMTGTGTDACTVTLKAAAPSAGLSVNLSSSKAAVTVPATVTVPANATSAGFTATVSAVGTTQTATLTASEGSISEIFALSLNAAVPTLALSTSGSPSTYGSAVTFTAAFSNGPTGTVTFYDGGASIGTGTINGTTATLTASSLIAGSHTITASWPGNSNYGAVASGAITQVVNKATPAITWNTPAAITYGTALSATQLDATSTVAGTFSYSPAAGTVLTAGSHTLTATFTPTDTTDYASATSSVSITVTQVTPAITWATPAAITYGTALSGTQLDASSTVAGSFSYSPAAGTVLTAGSHTITATFTPTDTTDYASATSSVSITVTQVAPAITWAAPAAISYGTALSSTQLDAFSAVAGTFVYSPAAGTVLTAGSHTITATFTPTDTTDYASATSSVAITVAQTTPAITWVTPAAITYGTALSSTQLDASSTVAGTFVYSPAAGTVLTAGSHTITATFTPMDTTDYASATSSVSIAVTQTTPAITWATPAAITYGTALSATQLDATSTVAGTFSYSPAAGTILAAGSQTLSVIFSPSDTTDYKTATATVTLTVNTGTPTLSINATSVGFGNVELNMTATQSVTLTSIGTAPVTVNSATLTGTGFSLPGAAFPITLNPSQVATLNVQFDPVAAGVATGQLTIASNSSTGATAVISLSGTGTQPEVELDWEAPSSPADPIAGYNVYRAPGGTTAFQLLNASEDTETTYTDSTVQSGQSYDYTVTSVDASGVESAPSSMFAVAIP
jgi:LEA14-like dessication related protein